MDEDAVSAQLIRDARWLSCLTQAEMAQRAGVTRQMISAYESGARSPSVGTLDRLLAGCGVRLRLSMVPEPGLEDVPTRKLLATPVLERIELPLVDALVDLADAVGDHRLFLVSGKAAARLHGACVRVEELEIWFSTKQPVADIRAWLADAGIAETFPLDTAALSDGITLEHAGVTDVVLRAEPHFDGFLHRSSPLDLERADPLDVSLVEAGDCTYGWHPRDRDHLALQRAIRLAAHTK
ncbi:MAG TPA: helix-turn-helix transcriptional regulator [Frankiaceae bacterium]|nr:helix-turn-helix transcriptional regulator [Frankiaceae bacterium]